MNRTVYNLGRNSGATWFLVLVLVIGLSLPSHAQWKAKLRLTTSGEMWANETELPLVPAANAATAITVDTATKFQTIDGFGGCFNELGWQALNTLPVAMRDSVIRALFDTVSGCKFNICRMPIGASDYALNWYSLNDSQGDYEMSKFSIARDTAYLLKYIKAAMKYRPGLKVWGSPWSPPAWMKTPAQYNGGHINWNDQTLNSYALYLEKAIRQYQAAGINFYALSFQNESTQWPIFPGCQWTQDQHRDFIKLYLGPKFTANNVPCEIWTPTMNCSDYTYFQAMLGDPQCAKYITTVCFQWSGKNNLTKVVRDYPKFKVFQSETECGDGTNTFAYGFDPTFRYMNFYLSNTANGYMQWNMVLDHTGMSAWKWAQNAMITVDTVNKKVIFNAQYYVAKHFSYYIMPNAKKIKSEGNYGIQDAATLFNGADGQLAFQNPDRSIVVVLDRTQSSAATVAVKVGTQMVNVNMPSKSFATVVIYPTSGTTAPKAGPSPESSNPIISLCGYGNRIVVTFSGTAASLHLVGMDGSIKVPASITTTGSISFETRGLASGIYILKGFIDGRPIARKVCWGQR